MPFSAFLAVLGACLMWGTTGIVASGMSSDVSTFAIGAFTMGVGGLILGLVTFRGIKRILAIPGTRRWVVAGGMGVFIYPLAFYAAMHDAGVAVGNCIAIGSGPLFAGLIQWVTRARRPSLVWAVSLAVAITGLAMVGAARGGEGPNALRGVLLAVLAGSTYALYSVAGNRLIVAGGSFSGSMGAVFGAGSLPLIMVLAFTAGPIVSNPENLLRSAYLALGPLVLAYQLFGFALTIARVENVTLVTLLEPVFATTLAVVLLHETLPLYGWVGIVLLILSVALAALPNRASKAPEINTSAQ